MRYWRRTGAAVPERASRDACVVAWLVLGVSALLPFGAEAQCTLLTCDVAVNASIDTSGEVDCFAFTASDGEIVDISVVSQAAGGSFRPSWILLDSSGTPVDGPCGSFGPSEPNYPCGPLAASGSPYGLGVRASHEGDDTGAYAVRFERVTAAYACEDIPLTCAVPVVETTDNPLDTDLFSFSVSDGEMVEISVMSGWHGGTVIGAAWELIDGTGNPVDGSCGQFAQSELYYVCGPLPASGNPYRIEVGDNDDSSAGQYKVRYQPLTLAEECSNTALECGRALTTAIADPPPDQLCGFALCPVLDTKLFHFSVNDGERIAVTVDTLEPTGPHFLAGWRLLDRTGNPVEGPCADISTAASSFVCGPLAAAGNPYQLEVGAALDLVFGNARVLVNFLTGPCATECTGDCDGSGDVVITDLLRAVNVALGNATIAACGPGDANRDGMITIEEILTAVNKALEGCEVT